MVAAVLFGFHGVGGGQVTGGLNTGHGYVLSYSLNSVEGDYIGES